MIPRKLLAVVRGSYVSLHPLCSDGRGVLPVAVAEFRFVAGVVRRIAEKCQRFDWEVINVKEGKLWL